MERALKGRVAVAGLVAACLSSLGGIATHSAASVSTAARVDHASSVAAARQFLYRMMDLRATGAVPRLVQSFAGGRLGSQHFTDSETYDDALIIDALIADGTAASLARARTIANALLFVQKNDPKPDGRIRSAYAPDQLTSRHAIRVTDPTSDVGAMAWAAMALVRLAAVSHDAHYLSGARRIGTWVARHCRDRRGAGGFHWRLHRPRAKDLVEVDRAQHRPVRAVPDAREADRQSALDCRRVVGAAVRSGDVAANGP